MTKKTKKRLEKMEQEILELQMALKGTPLNKLPSLSGDKWKR